MKRRFAVVITVTIVAVLAVGAATAAAPPPPPPKNAAMLIGLWPNLKSLVGNKAEYGSLDVSYSVRKQQLSWTLDYKGTTGPATDVRLRMRISSGLLSLSLCKPGCHSTARKNVRGAYYHMGGTINRPPRDLLLMATGQAATDIILATKEHPAGELRAEIEASPVAVGSSGGHCC